MRRKSLEMTSNQVKNGLEWGDSMSGAPRAVEKETSRQRRSCARWVFPQPAKSTVDEGAVVKLSGRYYVIAVSTSKFTCHGRELMGISTMAPIFDAIGGAQAGDTVQFNGRGLTVEEVA